MALGVIGSSFLTKDGILCRSCCGGSSNCGQWSMTWAWNGACEGGVWASGSKWEVQTAAAYVAPGAPLPNGDTYSGDGLTCVRAGAQTCGGVDFSTTSEPTETPPLTVWFYQLYCKVNWGGQASCEDCLAGMDANGGWMMGHVIQSAESGTTPDNRDNSEGCTYDEDSLVWACEGLRFRGMMVGPYCTEQDADDAAVTAEAEMTCP